MTGSGRSVSANGSEKNVTGSSSNKVSKMFVFKKIQICVCGSAHTFSQVSGGVKQIYEFYDNQKVAQRKLTFLDLVTFCMFSTESGVQLHYMSTNNIHVVSSQ